MAFVDTPDRPDGLAAALSSAFAVDDEHLATLNAQLASRADRSDVLDVAFRFVGSPFGDLLVAATDVGIVRVAFESEGHAEVLADLARTIGPRILESTLRTDEAARQLEEYFARDRRSFDLPVDLRLVNGFRRDVVTHLPDIAYGTTSSYAALATRLGNPGAVRAVGSACSHNPVPVVFPCHRVVRSDGSIGNYLGGSAAKRALLDLEAA